MKIRRLDHIHIYSGDPEESVRYYANVFGAEPVGTARTSRGGAMHFVRLGGLSLVVAPYPPGTTPGAPPEYGDGAYQRGYGVAHFGLEVENLDQAVESLRGRGAKILAGPATHQGLRYAYVGAPDGVIVELLQYDGDWKALLGAPPPTPAK